jgi:hypothetical protein
LCLGRFLYGGRVNREPRCWNEKALAEEWNGTAWSVVPTAASGAVSQLDSVSCVSGRHSCTAVGYHPNSVSTTASVIENWNARKWSLRPSPTIGIDDGLSGVSCVSARSCKAVGQHVSDKGIYGYTLTETSKGRKWSVVPSVSFGTIEGLNSVSCVSASSCMAVGFAYSRSTGGPQTLIEHWNYPCSLRPSAPFPRPSRPRCSS